MEGLKLIPYIALILAISGIILGASVIMLAKFGDTVDTCYNSTFTYNASTEHCTATNSSGYPLASHIQVGKGNLNFSDEYFAIWKSIEGETTVAEQQPTIAIIAVMVIIISVLSGVFVYMRYFA